ncbi:MULTISPECIES: hypothetical protein [unclassified Nocardia]|uniref:hypothetical protein n=1 Tax=unclassified Nocardia TaxID=2637762 RepID=UPI00278C3D20|nr:MULTISPECIES: hypothetical protein [unclassified Nocardia]
MRDQMPESFADIRAQISEIAQALDGIAHGFVSVQARQDELIEMATEVLSRLTADQ